MTDEVISPLRRRMIEDMTIRTLVPKAQQGLHPVRQGLQPAEECEFEEHSGCAEWGLEIARPSVSPMRLDKSRVTVPSRS
jgi:hypothetical protein